MSHEPDNSGPETYRDLVRRRHRSQTFRKRILVLLIVGVVVVGALVFWISQTMISPPRPRISDSERPVIGVVLRDDPSGGAAVLSAVPPASAAGLRAGDRIVSVDGRVVTTLVDRVQDPGRYSVVWNGRDADGIAVASGVYFCELSYGGEKEARKMTLLK